MNGSGEIGTVAGVLALAGVIVREAFILLRRRNGGCRIDWEERDLHIRMIVREELEKFTQPHQHRHQ